MSAQHNRLKILRLKTKVFCPEHGIQQVIDLFQNAREGNTLKLKCGCRRKESV